jgi:hypothetical protein
MIMPATQYAGVPAVTAAILIHKSAFTKRYDRFCHTLHDITTSCTLIHNSPLIPYTSNDPTGLSLDQPPEIAAIYRDIDFPLQN